MTEDEAREHLNRIRSRAQEEKTQRAAVRAAFKARRDAGLARRHAARLRFLQDRTRAEQVPPGVDNPASAPHTESGTA